MKLPATLATRSRGTSGHMHRNNRGTHRGVTGIFIGGTARSYFDNWDNISLLMSHDDNPLGQKSHAEYRDDYKKESSRNKVVPRAHQGETMLKCKDRTPATPLHFCKHLQKDT